MRQGSALEPIAAEDDHRRRLTAAMVAAAAENGYREATVARIVVHAGVSRATFYEHFGCREECFRAVYREEMDRVLAEVRAAAEAVGPSRRPDAVIDAVLDSLASDPATARFVLVEALAVPAAGRREHEQLILEVDGAIAGFLDDQSGPGAIQIPSAALLAGIADVLARRSLGGQTEDHRKLRKELSLWIDRYRLRPTIGECCSLR